LISTIYHESLNCELTRETVHFAASAERPARLGMNWSPPVRYSITPCRASEPEIGAPVGMLGRSRAGSPKVKVGIEKNTW